MCQWSAEHWINVHFVLYSPWIYSRHLSTLFWNHFLTPIDKFFNFCFSYILEIYNKYSFKHNGLCDFHVSVQRYIYSVTQNLRPRNSISGIDWVLVSFFPRTHKETHGAVFSCRFSSAFHLAVSFSEFSDPTALRGLPWECFSLCRCLRLNTLIFLFCSTSQNYHTYDIGKFNEWQYIFL